MKRETNTIDATGKVLGRLASEIVILLRGKHKADFVPNKDIGDFVVVTNIEKIKITGKKMDQKKYYHHSSYMGGLKTKPLNVLFKEKPSEILRKAVWGMLPKNKLGRAVYRKLFVYTGPEHRHQAQKPEIYEVTI